MLKQWCLLGTESGTKAARKELWARVVTMVENNALPSMAELDGQVAAAALQRKVRVRADMRRAKKAGEPRLLSLQPFELPRESHSWRTTRRL